MRGIIFIALISTLAAATSCGKDEPSPSNYINVTISETEYTFLGLSIYEPHDLFKDTLKNTIYLGGYIGDCTNGATQFVDIQLNQSSEGSYELADGLQFWVETNDHAFFAKNDSPEMGMNLTIIEFGAVNDRISGTFSGMDSVRQVSISGSFSLQRITDNSGTYEVISELCQ